MESTAARPLSLPHPAATALVPADHVHDLIAEKSALERDLKSARVRNRTLTRALNGQVVATEPLATIRGAALVAPFLHAARVAEAMGEVPVVRFARDQEHRIVGIELALLEREDTGTQPLISFPAEFGGMEVLA
jgi:hypothetical protein